MGENTIQSRNSKGREQVAIPYTEDEGLQAATGGSSREETQEDPKAVRLAQSSSDQVSTEAPCKVLGCGDRAHRAGPGWQRP